MKTNKSAATILYFATIFFWFSQLSYAPYVNPALSTMGATATFIGFVSGLYGLVQLIIRIPLGIVADKFNLQKIFICVGTTLAAICGLGMFLTYSPLWFLFFRGLAGVASSTWVCFTVMYSNYFDEKDGAQAISLLSLGNYVGRFVGLVISGVVTQALGARASFFVAFCGGAVAVVISVFVKNIESDKAPLKIKDLLMVLHNRNLIVVSGLAVLTQVLLCSTVGSFATIIAKNVGATNMNLASISMLTVASTVAVSFLASKVVIPRFGYKIVLFAGFLFMVIYCIGITFMKDVVGIYCIQLLAGFGEGLTLPILTGLSIKGVNQDKKSTSMGFYQAIYGVGMAAGPIMMGVLVDCFQYRIAFIVMGVLAGVAMMCTTVFIPSNGIEEE